MPQFYYTVEKLGPNQSLTPDGFLLCESVPIARTGIQIYGAHEVDITPDSQGIVYVNRSEEEVFRPETIASFNGKPIIIDHPSDGNPITPDTWSQRVVGIVLNPRRGEGENLNYLLADLLVCTPEAIDLVRSEERREVSCGYGANWEETSIGHGEQKNIIGNHLALVDRARCGGRCSIGDNKGDKMFFDKLKESLMKKFKVKTEEELQQVLKGKTLHFKDDDIEEKKEEEPKERSKFTDEELENRFKAYDDKHAAHDVRHAGHDAKHRAHDEMLKTHGDDIGEIKEHLGMAGDDEEEHKILGELKEEAPPGTGDGELKQAQDSSLLADSFSSTLAIAEIIVPGIQLPAFDRTHKIQQTFKDMCSFRRKVLILGAKDQHTAMLMQESRNGRSFMDSDIQSMTCSQVRDFFNSVGALKKRLNNMTSTSASVSNHSSTHQGGVVGPKSIAEINRRNREKFGGTQ